MIKKRNKRKSIRAGIEIECIINYELIPIFNQEFQNKLNKIGWEVKQDGSLRGNGEFNHSRAIELICKATTGKKRFIKRINDLKKFLIETTKEKELNKIMVFNTSCGCHFHQSITQNIPISSFLAFPIIREFRKNFFKELEKTKLKNKNSSLCIKNHYFRKYAKRTTADKFNSRHRDRYYELNRISEVLNKGLEWRSFNLLGCNNWEDFLTLIELGYDSFSWLLNKRLKGYTIRQTSFKIQNENQETEKQIIEIEIPKEKEIYELNYKELLENV